MPTTQTILWVALPHGRQGQVLQLSVFVSPRLFIEWDQQPPVPTLSQFPDFLHWTQKVSSVEFEVEVADGTPKRLSARRVSQTDPTLWDALFTADTFVRPYIFDDYSGRIVRSFPTEVVGSYIQEVYGTTGGSSPTELPPLPGAPESPVGKVITELGPVRANPAEHGAQTMEADLARDKVVRPGSLHGFATEVQLGFHQAGRFYARPENKQSYGPLDPTKTPLPPALPEIDFHQMVTRLADYPEILRRLGLVIDLEVALPAGGISAESTVQVRPIWNSNNLPVWFANTAPAPTHTDRSARTTYTLSSLDFLAQPRPSSDLSNGMLQLNDPKRFECFQLDIDGSALKVMDFALNMQRLLHPGHGPYTTPSQAGLPALRSGGFSVARHERASALVDQLTRAKALHTLLESGGDPILFADDLVRGYRLDIHDNRSKQWHSLHWRLGTYEFPKTTAQPLRIQDEGYMKGASPTAATPDPNADLYVHETMFGWDGWSLCVARPGRTIVPQQQGDRQEEILARVPNQAVDELFPFQTSFQVVPGTLPRLRYGTTCQLRARAVDLAGNSVPAESPDSTRATPAQPYLRFEPVPSPVLLLRDRVTEGESLERMVIRSNYDVSPAEYVQLPQVQAATAGQGYRYKPDNERHVAPPKTSQLMAELHGMFDAAIGAGKNYRHGFNLAVKEEGTFLDMFVVDPQTGQPTIPVIGIELVTPPGVTPTPGQPLPSLPLTRGQALAPGQYVIHTTDHLQLPYLPDVFARGVMFVDLPGMPHLLQPFPFDSHKWPDLTPFRLRIVEGEGAPVFDTNAHLLEVRLPKATIATVRYSCHLADGDEEKMAIWHWIDKDHRHKSEVLSGLHWMFTPYRELTFVHAVQQPLQIPEFSPVVAQRTLGGTSVSFTGSIALDSPSTSTIAVEAEWHETVDVLTKHGPELVTGKAHVASFDVEYEERVAFVGPTDIPKQQMPLFGRHRMVHEFGDTKYRQVEYYSVATTRFREYFPPAITKDPANITRSGKESSEVVETTTGAANGARVLLHILNSARPAAPKLQYVIPTFGWQQQSLASGGVQRTRLGNGLRLYLDRPWYSSGDGELLAILLCEGLGAADFKQIPERLKPYVTQWGDDPLWGPTATASHARSPLTAGDFPLAQQSMTGLTLDEVAGTTVTAVGHPVEYDPSRQLWFCDIAVDPPASFFRSTYAPFVRLAMARFQPRSLPNAHVSRVILTDFVQLVPDRRARLEFPDPNDAKKLQVTVSGVYGINDITESLPKDTSTVPNLEASRVVQVSLQVPNANNIGGDLGWVKVGAETTLSVPPGRLSSNNIDWRGTLTLPQVPKSKGGSQTFRVLIQEFERLRTDSDVQEFTLTRSGQSFPMRSRLVYADALEL